SLLPPPTASLHHVALHVSPHRVLELPQRLRRTQRLFESTGGLHAAGLFDRQGHIVSVYEDVGRHNALDKLVGSALLAGRLPLHAHMLMLSGRASYELLHKSIGAGLPLVCAVSAPSSYAVRLAADCGVTLIGFLRGNRFNIYSGSERILPSGQWMVSVHEKY